MNLDSVLICTVLGLIATVIGAAFAVIAFVYQFLRNFKADIKADLQSQIAKLENRMDSLEERMFWLATGKKLEDAIQEERLKRENFKTNS